MPWRKKILDSIDEVELLDELSIDCINDAFDLYRYNRGKIKREKDIIITNEQGKHEIVGQYMGYFNESYEEAMEREKKEAAE